MVVGAILAHMGMKPRHKAWGPSWVAILAKVSKRLTVKFDDGTTEAIDFTEEGIRITREAPAPAPAPVAPSVAVAQAPAPMEMSTEHSPVVAAAAPAPAPADHVPLLAGVRLFLFGARDQLNSYDLRHLSEVPDGDRPPAPADLTNIANYFCGFRRPPST